MRSGFLEMELEVKLYLGFHRVPSAKIYPVMILCRRWRRRKALFSLLIVRLGAASVAVTTAPDDEDIVTVNIVAVTIF